MKILDSHEFIEMYRGDKDLRLGKIMCATYGCEYHVAVPNLPSLADKKLMCVAKSSTDRLLPSLPAKMKLYKMRSWMIKFRGDNPTLGGFFQLSPGYLRVIKRTNPDIILESAYTTLTPRMYMTFLGSVLNDVPVVYVDAGDIPEKGLLKRCLLRFERIVMRRVSLVITYNYLGKRRYMEEYGLEDERILVIPKPVDTGRFRPGIEHDDVASKYGLNDFFVVAYFGRLDFNKGSNVLLQVAAALKDNPAFGRVKFLLVGGSLASDEEKALLRAKDEQGLNSVIFSGHVEHKEMPELYALADVVVFPDVSNIPGFSTVLAESMASGKPIVIGCRGHELATPIRHMTNGIVVTPRSVDEIISALKLLVGDERLRRTLGAAVREYAVANMDWSVVADLYHDAIGKLLHSSNR